MARISDALRQQAFERARWHCEYCQAPLSVQVTVEIDHIVPESAGGPTDSVNLCATCRGCNQFKQAFQEAIDPETGEMVPLFNPRTQQWKDHFAWNDNGTLMIGLTPTGRATIIRLHVNREWVVKARNVWVEAGWHPPTFL